MEEDAAVALQRYEVLTLPKIHSPRACVSAPTIQPHSQTTATTSVTQSKLLRAGSPIRPMHIRKQNATDIHAIFMFHSTENQQQGQAARRRAQCVAAVPSSPSSLGCTWRIWSPRTWAMSEAESKPATSATWPCAPSQQRTSHRSYFGYKTGCFSVSLVG